MLLSAISLMIFVGATVFLGLGLTHHQYVWNLNSTCAVKTVADELLVLQTVDGRYANVVLMPLTIHRVRFAGLEWHVWEDRNWIPVVRTSTGTSGPISYGRRTEFILPLWWVLMLSAVLPFRVAIRLVERWREVKPGTCRNCGYDLRATPERCPECGTPQSL